MKGMYGKPPAPVDPEISKRIIGDEEVITCRPADLIEPEFDKFKSEGEAEGFVKSDEDALTYALYPPIAPKFLKGEAEEEELKAPRSLNEDEGIGIPTEYNVEVDGDVFEVKIMPTGFMEIGEGTGTTGGPVGDIEGGVISAMQGMVIKLNVNVGDKVEKGSTICVIEAMKMENDIQSEVDGVVEEIFVEPGDAVSIGDIIMVIK
jgi:pyruvate carboxylase subunit B